MGTKNKHIPKGVPKISLDSILHYLILQKSTNHNLILSPHFVFHYYKNFQLLTRLRGSALCLLKTQFAKKPVDHGLRCKN